jgi:hypothetical protein
MLIMAVLHGVLSNKLKFCLWRNRQAELCSGNLDKVSLIISILVRALSVNVRGIGSIGQRCSMVCMAMGSMSMMVVVVLVQRFAHSAGHCGLNLVTDLPWDWVASLHCFLDRNLDRHIMAVCDWLISAHGLWY